MTRMTGPDCVVMCNLINTHTHTHTHSHTQTRVCTRASYRGGDGSEGWEGAYEDRGKIAVGGESGDGNGVGGENQGVNGDGDRTGTGTRTGVEANQ